MRFAALLLSLTFVGSVHSAVFQYDLGSPDAPAARHIVPAAPLGAHSGPHAPAGLLAGTSKSQMSAQFVAVPEPGTYGLLAALGLLGFAVYRKWKLA
jgi:hypothetical protein